MFTFTKNKYSVNLLPARLLRVAGLLFFVLLLSRTVFAQCTYLSNTDFESNTQVTGVTIGSQNTMVPPWRTTASDGQIEVWAATTDPAAYSGRQFIELNANVVSTLYQNFTATAGSMFTLGFAHRGRQGTDVMRVSIGTPNPTSATVSSTTLVSVGTYSDDNTAWVFRTVNFTIPSSYTGTTFSVRFESVSAAGGNNSIGNFLDAISISDASPTSGRSASYTIACPANTADLTSYTANNAPANSTQTFHSGTPATDANKLSTPTAVPAGTYYTAFYNSVKGCYGATTTLTVTQTGVPTAPVLTITQPNCNTATGTIVITSPTGSSLTYSIDGTNYQSSTTFSGVNPGTYAVRARNGTTSTCTSASTAATITASGSTPATPTASVTQQPSCTVATGTIVVSAPTGTGLTYSINGSTYQSSTSFSAVSPGSYSVTVKNTSNCVSLPRSLTVNAQPSTPTAPTVSVVQPTCTTATGTITISDPTGADLTYSINGSTYQSSTSFTAVSPGSYSVTVQNSQGCISAPTATTINTQPPTPAAPTLSTVQPTCTTATGTITVNTPTGTGLTYSINGSTYQSSTSFSAVSPGSYSVTVKNAQGCVSAPTATTINAQPPTPAAPTISVTQPTCTTATGSITISSPTGTGLTYSIDGSTYQSSTSFSAVSPGSYSVTVKNSQGCVSAPTATTINAQPPTPAAPTLSTVQPTCTTATGSITISSPTGTGLTYSIDGSTYQSSTSFTAVSPGSYSVTVKNSQGCVSAPTATTINTQPPTPVLTLNSATTCAGQSTTLTVSGCTGGTLLWNTGDKTSSLIVIPVVTTTYSATCTNTSNCSASVSTTVTIRPTPSYSDIPTVTPATCTGTTANANAQISLTGLQNTERADISTGSTYAGPAYGAASNKTVSGSAVSFTGLSNPSSAQYYTVRLFSAGGTCTTDVVFLLSSTTCRCTSCPPVSLKRTK